LIKDLRANPPKAPSVWRFPNDFWRSSTHGEFYLNEEQAEVFFYILDALAPDDGSPPQTSRRAIDEMVSAFIVNALNFADEASEPFVKYLPRTLDGFKRSLNSRLTQWEIVGFLERIKVPPEGFEFGKVFFCDHAHQAIRFYEQKITKAEEQRANNNPIIAAFPKNANQYTFFRIFIEAGDDDAARQIAQSELESTLDILNFFASFFYLKDRLPALCEHHKHERKEAVFLRKKDSEGFNIQFANNFYHEVFDPLKISNDKEVSSAFKKTSELLCGQQNNWSERLISAIKWAGKGSVTRNRENAFMFYSIALEALLLGQAHHEQLSYKLRLRAAHMLGLKNSSRAKIRNRVSQLYSIRSKIVHCGSNKLSQSDLEELRIVTQSCIVRLLSDPIFKDFSKEEDLENWFEEMVVFGPEN
jgi:hypothetical protein